MFVTNCNDSGPGSLRNAVAGAPSGETVDATGLKGVCSTITLKTGAISVANSNLTIKGPGVEDLTLTAKYGDHQYHDRLLSHFGTGLLYLQDMSLTKGYALSDPAKGGCIYSKGSVKLKDVHVTGCEAKSSGTGDARGGGIFAVGTLTLTRSSVSLNGAMGGTGVGNSGKGAGTYSFGLRADFSNVYFNEADSQLSRGFVGGSFSNGDAYISNSTIARNQASLKIGGLEVINGNLKLVNSTISSNIAQKGSIGGLYATAVSPQIEIFNSTIASNSAYYSLSSSAPGATFRGSAGTSTVVMQSSIIANNYYGSSIDSDLSSNIPISGSNNLVMATNASIPGDTILGKCPLLGPLTLNGGLTPTHKLISRSPAIDAGNNAFGAGFDQRGSQSVNGDRNYPRVLGPPATTPRTDIGAYEVNRVDEIFDTEFEGC